MWVEAGEDLPAILKDHGVSPRVVEIGRTLRPYLRQKAYLANNPDLNPYCDAVGNLPRRKPILVVISKSIDPYSTAEPIVYDGAVVHAGAAARSKAGESGLRVSFDEFYAARDVALAAPDMAGMELIVRGALKDLRSMRLHRASRADRRRQQLDAGFGRALCAIGRGEHRAAHAQLESI